MWIPSKDTGIDLLVTDRENHRTASLQVKFGKDFLPGKGAHLQNSLRVCTWFTINRHKLHASQADFWVFALIGFERHPPDFVIVPTAEYRSRLLRIHGPKSKNVIQTYLWVTDRNRCWEARDLKIDDEIRIAAGKFKNSDRDFTQYLNEDGWATLVKKLN